MHRAGCERSIGNRLTQKRGSACNLIVTWIFDAGHVRQEREAKRARLRDEQAAAYIGAEGVPGGGAPNGGISVVSSDSQVVQVASSPYHSVKCSTSHSDSTWRMGTCCGACRWFFGLEDHDRWELCRSFLGAFS